jgi:hypothetical protein
MIKTYRRRTRVGVTIVVVVEYIHLQVHVSYTYVVNMHVLIEYKLVVSIQCTRFESILMISQPI